MVCAEQNKQKKRKKREKEDGNATRQGHSRVKEEGRSPSFFFLRALCGAMLVYGDGDGDGEAQGK
jgi:hypothetical protein